MMDGYTLQLRCMVHPEETLLVDGIDKDGRLSVVPCPQCQGPMPFAMQRLKKAIAEYDESLKGREA